VGRRGKGKEVGISPCLVIDKHLVHRLRSMDAAVDEVAHASIALATAITMP